jgi:hypothetical protein
MWEGFRNLLNGHVWDCKAVAYDGTTSGSMYCFRYRPWHNGIEHREGPDGTGGNVLAAFEVLVETLADELCYSTDPALVSISYVGAGLAVWKGLGKD